MPLFYQQNINDSTRLAIWKIEEAEAYFAGTVPLQMQITHPHKRLQHLAGRYLLRYLFPDFPYQEILIADTRKPYLTNEEYHFSISHCGDYAAAIVSKELRVGIDIELYTERVHKIKHKYLHPTELEFVNKVPIQQQTKLLTLLWSAKEAMFKWWGNGDIDFSEVMQVQSFEMIEEGLLQAKFEKNNFNQAIELTYLMLDKINLCYIAAKCIE